MIRQFLRFLLVFLAITGAVVIASQFFQIEFGHENYWDHHGVFLLIFLCFFPRLTLVVSSIPFGGLLWWLGWLFVPRILVASLATIAYWNSNPILVVISWLFALGGESSDKVMVFHRRSRAYHSNRKIPSGDVIDIDAERVD